MCVCITVQLREWVRFCLQCKHICKYAYGWSFVHVSALHVSHMHWTVRLSGHSCAVIPADTRAFTLHPHCESDCMLYSSRLHFPVSANMITAVPLAEIVWERACVFCSQLSIFSPESFYSCTQVRNENCICEMQKKTVGTIDLLYRSMTAMTWAVLEPKQCMAI